MILKVGSTLTQKVDDAILEFGVLKEPWGSITSTPNKGKVFF